MVNDSEYDETTTAEADHAASAIDEGAIAPSEPGAPAEAGSDEQGRVAETERTEPAGAEAAPAAAGEETTEPEPVVAEDGRALVVSLAELTPEERFRATARLVFLAPDVPPVQPRQRRSALRQLDDLLDQRFIEDPQDAAEERGRAEEREGGQSRRRGRRRTSQAGDDDAPPVKQKRQAPQVTEPQKVKGSTRLEAKKQRRREGRDAGRRRRLVITESEFLARREAVEREMIVRTTAGRIQIGVLEDGVLVEHYVARSAETSMIGNVYLGRVQNVLPSMEAAFVDIGRGRNAVLYSGEVDWSEFEGTNSARRIENALKPGDQVLVQVTKDPVGHKGARLTSQISLPGRFLVYVPGGAMNGISRKLPDTERARLKKILKEVLPSGAGVIVRTAAEGATEEQLTHDVQRLTKQWESIQKRVERGGGPVLLHSEPDMLIKIVRDVFNEDFHRLVISGEETYRTIEDYLSQVAPELLERVEAYTGERDVFGEYRISEQIAKALDRKVWLPSGGSLVIDRTEAMTVVDVNTGKFVGSGGNLEETVTKNNLEAAEEIVRQLRLRDIGGIIVVDFIDMVLESNRDLVLRRLVECLSRDRTKHQVAEVTSLGLVQMTRKKLGLGLLESFSEPCEVCAGRGIIVHHEPIAKHRSENGSRGKRKGGSGSQPSGSVGQTHAITDESRTMLAKIAASTITGAADHGGSPAEADPAGDETKAAAEAQTGKQSRRRRAPKQETAAKESEPAEVVRPREQPVSPDDLLGSVLDALPPAPAPGKRRRAGRRASSLPLVTPGSDADPASDDDGASLI
ncbi:Rne/Rng family ribonuclease [Leucobacter weissii]|uniref:Ribonuclease E n=1 Tax=Leucobacter weissii TaxID=1983706 RepID=A0A939SAG7_9MICO|nr:Rne/Rng family ribonuclease [Leucobacter weissii]MBO1901932.1 Rne/Rng family ribonuclease [Leucobacter weissii]